MTLLECKEMVIERLRTLRVCQPNSVQTQWIVRCPYCGDSRDPSHGHFSILINRNSDDIMLYRCFKCNESGILTPETLESLGIYLNEEDRQALRSLNRPNGKSTYFKSKPKLYEVPPVIMSDSVEEKIEYLSSRIGIEFTEEKIHQCKIVTSIVDFINMNHIPVRGMDRRLLQTLEDHYVGFLAANNNKVIFRNIHNDRKNLLRYYKWTIDPYNTSPNNFYSPINTPINLLYTDPVHIHIAEGTFDIISIMYNLPHDPTQTHLFYGSCGYNFGTIIKYLTYMGVNTDVNVHIYSDADKTDADDIKVLNSGRNKVWIDHAVIHRNMFIGEKDFGVPKDHIIDQFITIK